MLELTRKIIFGGVLTTSVREQLIEWLIANKTSDRRLRAGLPKDWKIGDKTGTGGAYNNATNGLAVIWPPARPPIIVTAFYAEADASLGERETVLAEVGRNRDFR